MSDNGDNTNNTIATHGSRIIGSRERKFEERKTDHDNEHSPNEDNQFWRFPKMDKVLYRATILSNFVYIIVGVYGYLTFSSSSKVTYEQLQAP